MKNLKTNLKGLYNILKKSNSNFKFSKEIFDEKFKIFPSWMQNQIDTDFYFWKNKKTDIDKTIKKFKDKKLLKDVQLIRIKIKNNQFFYQNFMPHKLHPRFIRFKSFMKNILKFIKIPDADFLYSINDTFDNPEWLELLEAPVFCISKKKGNNKVVLFPHVEWMEKNDQLINEVCKSALHFPWNEKLDKAFWIGSSTGFNDLNKNERFKIVKLSKKYPRLIEANFSSIDDFSKKIQDKYLENFKLKTGTDVKQQLSHKCLFAIDGHAFAGSFFWQLFSNSLILKNKSDYLEWYYSGLKKGSHFLEYKDERDILEILENLKSNQERLKRIIENANLFAKENLSNESICLFVFKIFQKVSDLS